MLQFSAIGYIKKYIPLKYGMSIVLHDCQKGYEYNGKRIGDRSNYVYLLCQNLKQCDTIKNTFRIGSLVSVTGTIDINLSSDSNGEHGIKASECKFSIDNIKFFNTIDPNIDKKLESYNDKVLGDNKQINSDFENDF